jgi:Flp pilus assembly protein TadG
VASSQRPRPQRRDRRARQAGQSLVEFSLVIPLFLILLMAVIEFAFLMNGQLSINYATRDAALVAAEAGNAVGADCVILQKVEQDVTAPANPANISQVQVFWTNANGQPLDTSGNVTTFGSATQAADTYARTGSTTCTFVDGTTLTVPYMLQGTATYPDSVRCNDIQGTSEGCGTGHAGLDTIGVEVTYSDTWRTPLHNLIGLLGNGWTLVQSNEMRMEPVL